MSERDTSWTIAPTLACFAAFAIAGLVWLDGDLDAIAGRFVAAGSDDGAAPVVAAGPSFVAKRPVVADVDDDDGSPHGGGGGGGGGGAATAGSAAGSGAAGSGARTGGYLEDACLDGAPDHCKRWAMDGFYKSVVAEKASKLGRAVRVSWYGDSVTATDEIPGHLRTKLQAVLGDGGPGFVFWVAPHRFCGHEAITRWNNGGWNTYGISTQLAPDGWYGVGGASADTDGGTATVKLVAGTATTVELYYLRQPKGGTAVVTAGATEVVRADTAGDKAAGYAAGTIAAGASRVDLSTTGRVRVFGVDLENTKGAVVDNLGIVSANVKSFANHDLAAWQGELSHRSADLVMIMIGANEAEWLGPYDQDTKDYAAHYEKILDPIRKGRPDAACLVVSPTDQAEAKDGAFPSRPVMPVLVAAQRKAAKDTGCAFFSTYDWMGGKGSASKWYAHGLVGSDFQHLTPRGAVKLGDAVYDALMAGVDVYEHEPGHH
jgi:lysophospholipase L1-like esterase|nr:GDSL-type esterase/lipase family protein [Kofleriaceae bacterium]